MEISDENEINAEDLFAEISLEVEEIDSIIKILCLAMENIVQSETEMTDIKTILFMLQGNLCTLKNNLRITQSF